MNNLSIAGFVPLRTIHLSFVPDEEIGGVEGMGELLKTPEFCLQLNGACTPGFWAFACLDGRARKSKCGASCETLPDRSPAQEFNALGEIGLALDEVNSGQGLGCAATQTS